MATFNLEIITPKKLAYKDEVSMIITRTTEGDMGVLANHAPLVTELAIGEMVIKKNKEQEKYFISGGFLEISKEKTLVLADKAIPASEIDIEAEKEKQRIEKAKLKKLSEDREIAATQKSITESLTKIRMYEG